MDSTDVFTFLDAIPSDNESELGDVSEDEQENDQNGVQNIHNDDLFDIVNMPIDFVDEVTANKDNRDNEWDSEDELPLSTIRGLELQKKTIWTQSTDHCLQNMKQFSEEYGPNIPEELESPVQVFLHLFPESLIDHIVFQTNLYTVQKYGNTNSFKQTNSSEIKAFLSANILMGIKQLPSYRDYWSSRAELRDNFISELLPRDRFIWLLGNLHLNDNSVLPTRESPHYDKLYKLRPVLDKLSDTFLSSYKPSKNQAIDESMIKFKGRSSLKQYMPLKPTKRGYKVWVRADETGYLCEFQIYVGKVGDTAEKDLGARVVRDLSNNLIGKGHHLYFDNYFNSIPLQKTLQSQFIYACGTVRRARKELPNDLRDDKALSRGEFDWRVSKDGLVYVKWKDRKAVHLLANYSDPSISSKVNRKQHDGTTKEFACPLVVVNYNENMGFVDKLDMIKSTYEIDRKSKKWWQRIFWYCVDMAVVNSYIIFKNRSNGSATLTQKEFRLSVAVGLVGADRNNTPKKGRPTMHFYKVNVPPEVRYDSCSHMPLHCSSRRCALCTAKSETHRTRWMCTR